MPVKKMSEALELVVQVLSYFLSQQKKKTKWGWMQTSDINKNIINQMLA